MTPFSRPNSPDRPPSGKSRDRTLTGGDSLPAIAVGALLAIACWLLALHADPQVDSAGYAGFFAFVMVAAGAASFVLYALHAHAEGRSSSAPAITEAARRLTLLLGASFSGSMYLLNACLAG